MSIRNKLLLNLLVAVGCILSVGAVGYFSTHRLENVSFSLFEDHALPLLQLETIEHTAEQIFLYLVLHNDAQDLDTMMDYEQKISEAIARMDAQKKAYQGLVHSSTFSSTAELEEFHRKWEQFMETAYAIISLSRDFEKEFAFDKILHEGQQHFEETLFVLSGHMREYRTQMERLQRDTIKARENAGLLIGGGVFLGSVVCALYGVLMRRDITRLLTESVEFARHLDRGELTSSHAAYKNDELGQVLSALHSMSQTIRCVLTEMDRLVRRLKDGDLTLQEHRLNLQGGWEELLTGFYAAIDAVTAPVHAIGASIDRISQGNISSTITEAYAGDFNIVKNKLNAMSENLNKVVANVKTAGETVASSSQQVSSSAADLSQGANEQASISEEVLASMEHMLLNTAQNAQNAASTEDIALRSAQNARESGDAVAETVHAMRKIAKTISLVEEISQQTHLLSLNATIEAAKAQEYGKGFAVVAAEVRKLAARSREAAEDITDLANSGVEIAERAREQLSKLVPNIETTSTLVQEISHASREQSMSLTQVKEAIHQLNQVIQENASTSEEMNAMSEELTQQAALLYKTITFFQVKTAFDNQTPTESLDVQGMRILPKPGNNGHKRYHNSDRLDKEFERY